MIHLIIIFSSIIISHSRPLPKHCPLDKLEINKLLFPTVEENTFSVEPTLGLKYDENSEVIKEALEYIKQKQPESNITDDDLRTCLKEILNPVEETGIPGNINGNQQPPGLFYFKPWYLGGHTSVGVPIPDEEEYKPGSEGYTTYLSPHNFNKKIPEYKPWVLYSFNNFGNFLNDAYQKFKEEFQSKETVSSMGNNKSTTSEEFSNEDFDL